MTTEVGTDLHTRIREALQERIRLAKTATPGPWGLSGDGLAVYGIADLTFDGGIPREAIPQAKADGRYMVANSPDVEIRRAEAGLRILKFCEQFAEPSGAPSVIEQIIRDLADMEGVDDGDGR